MRTWLGLLVIAAFALGLAISMQARQSSSQQNQKKVPDEYYQLLGRANYAFQHAKNKDGYAAAAKLYQQAAKVAPWLPDTYYNLGEAQKFAEEFSDAVASLQHYLKLKPNASDRDKVKIKIDELRGEAEQAATAPPPAEQPSSQNMSAQQPQSDAEFIRSINGARYEDTSSGGCVERLTVDADADAQHTGAHGQSPRNQPDFVGPGLHHENICPPGGYSNEYNDLGWLPISGRQAILSLSGFRSDRCGQRLTRIVYVISVGSIIEKKQSADGTLMRSCGMIIANNRLFKRVR